MNRASTEASSGASPGLGNGGGDSGDEPDDPDEPSPPGGETAVERAPVELVIVALGAAAVGIAFRFIARTPLWLDEALSVNIAALPIGDIGEALRHDGHPPLYYYLLHWWMDLFGTSDFAVRAFSGVTSVITLPVAWLAGRRRGGPILGWTMVAVLSISTFAVRYGTGTRMYSLIILMVFAGYLVLDDVLRRGRTSWWRWVLLGVISGALLLTHYWSMFLLASVGIVLLWRYWRGRNGRALQALAAMSAGSLVLFAAWIPSFRYQSQHTGTPWASPMRPTATFATALQDFHTITSDFKDPVLAIAATSVLFALGLFGIAVSSRRIDLDLRTVPQVRLEAVVLLITLSLGTVAGLAMRSAFASRYASVIFPFFVLVVAAGITRFSSRAVRVGVLVSYLALSMLGVVQVSLVYQRTEAKVIADAVSTRARPGDLVVYCPDQLGPAGERVMRDDLKQVAFPTMASPERVDWRDYAERNRNADSAALASQALSMAGPDHSIFVVWAGSYKTFENKCEELMHALRQQRPEIDDLVTGDSDIYFEHANLKQFKPES